MIRLLTHFACVLHEYLNLPPVCRSTNTDISSSALFVLKPYKKHFGADLSMCLLILRKSTLWTLRVLLD